MKLRPEAEKVFGDLWSALFGPGRLAGGGVVVASAGPQEGASTVTCGLALAGSGAGAGAKVALVDFNLSAPVLHGILRAPPEPGITDIICDGRDATDVVQPINDCLDFYPAGIAAGRIPSVLQSDALGELLNVLAANYDQVLVDSAAVCQCPEAEVIVERMTQVVLVVSAGQTRREAAAEAVRRIVTAGGSIVGLVLNEPDRSLGRLLRRRP